MAVALTQQRLRALLDYDPETGVFRWLKDGSLADRKHSRGYYYVPVQSRHLLSHRLAFFYVTGAWPSRLDHRDGNKKNNAWENLRECTQSQNIANSKKASTNTSGFKGVSLHKQTGKWHAYIGKNGRRRSLGLHWNVRDAAAAYARESANLFGDFARTD